MNTQYIHPSDARKVREIALEMAVRSVKPGTRMVEIVDRAHYFAHHIMDNNRHALCERGPSCPFEVPLTPSHIAD